MTDTELPLARPEKTPPCRPGTFELGLALAGAVSGGAYAAGVLDFLYEALERWYAARDRKEKVPDHDVLLRVISGASAGSVNGLLSSLALPHAFPHVHASTASPADNPFYDTWVERLDIEGLLRTGDLEGPDASLVSLLDSNELDRIAERVMRFEAPAMARPYVASPFKCIYTVTNLRGVPYKVPFAGSTPSAAHHMVAHADYLRFAVDTGNGAYDRTWEYPDDLYVGFPRQMPDRAWNAMREAALASAAFPGGLRYRQIERRWSDYAQRSVAVPDAHGQVRMVSVAPAERAPSDRGAGYRFVGVDGGAMDNEPFELARTELAGSLGRNPRLGNEVNRIVVMIDPFPEPDELGPAEASQINILESMTALFSSWKQQARFKPEEVALAMDDTVYSRFLIAPTRHAADGNAFVGGKALAAGGLGGFAGFFSKAYRRHDFLLGRRNCQWFLAEHFVVPVDNPLVAGWARDPALACYLRRRDGVTYAPVIPLLEACHPADREEVAPEWPKGAFDPGTLEKPLRDRLQALYRVGTKNWTDKILTWLAWRTYARGKLMDIAMGRIRKALKDADLI
ncbi:patatin-like phospholipase family protein [Luteibacter sp. CQ10]|uniref:patatin-like phospholipase family protein n=1 Tax=Luteibacter sp. CQ10 TaxID=2805821 RepID=UPI0034A5184A